MEKTPLLSKDTSPKLAAVDIASSIPRSGAIAPGAPLATKEDGKLFQTGYAPLRVLVLAIRRGDVVSLLLWGLEQCLAQSGCVSVWSERMCGCGGARGPSACQALHEMVIRLLREPVSQSRWTRRGPAEGCTPRCCISIKDTAMGLKQA